MKAYESAFKRIIAFLLAFVMAVPGNIGYTFASDSSSEITEDEEIVALSGDESNEGVSAQDLSDSGIYFNMEWEDSKFKNGSSYNLVEPSSVRNQVTLKVSYSSNKVREEGYAAGELIISVKGIGNVNRSGVIEALVGADKQGSTNKTHDWTYTWNKTNDTYTLVNNEPIKPNSVFSGYFELVYLIDARSSIDRYVQEDVQAIMYLPDEEPLSSDVLSFTNDTKADEFAVYIEEKEMYSYEGLVNNIENPKDYFFVRYRLTAGYEQYNSRGLNTDYYTFNPDCEGLGGIDPDNGNSPIVISPSLSCYSNNDGTYKVDLNRSNEYYLFVAYPKDVYNKTTVTAGIYEYGSYYEGDDQGDTSIMLLDDDYVSVYLAISGFDFSDIPGDVYEFTKESYYSKRNISSSKYGGNINGQKMVSGTEEIFYLEGFLNVSNGRKYTLEFVDDFLYIMKNNGEFRQLEADEYEFTKVVVPSASSILNINKLPVKSDEYEVEIYTASNGSIIDADVGSMTFEVETIVEKEEDPSEPSEEPSETEEELDDVSEDSFNPDEDSAEDSGEGSSEPTEESSEPTEESSEPIEESSEPTEESSEPTKDTSESDEDTTGNASEPSEASLETIDVGESYEPSESNEDPATPKTDSVSPYWSGYISDMSQTVYLPEGTTYVVIVIKGIEETFKPYSIPIYTKFHIKDTSDLEYEEQDNLASGQVVNTTFIRVWEHIKGETVETETEEGIVSTTYESLDWFNDEFTEEYYHDFTNLGLDKKDIEVYGEYLDREKANITFYEGEKNDYSSLTSVGTISISDRLYTTNVSIGASFDFVEDEYPNKFSIYTILPEGTELYGYNVPEDIWNIMSLSGLDIKEEDLAAACTPEIEENYNGSGRTYIGLHFDFGDVQVSQSNKIKATFAIRLESYSNVYVRSCVVIDEDITRYTSNKRADAGTWGDDTALFNDIDNDGDTAELIASSYSWATISPYAKSSQLQFTKYVKTSYSDTWVQLPKVPYEEFGGTYQYMLVLENGNSVAKNIVISDIIESGENSEWQGTLQSVEVLEVDGKDTGAVVYYRDDTGDWSDSYDTYGENTKAVEVRFGDFELQDDGVITVIITMKAPEDTKLSGKITENDYSASFTMYDIIGSNETKYDNLSSNFVQVRLTTPLRSVVITKQDAESGVKLSGAEFELINAETDEVVDTTTSNEAGYAIFSYVPAGFEYILRETKAPQGYDCAEDITISVDSNDYYIFIKDPRKVGKAEVHKVNNLDNSLAVEGAEYTLYGADGKAVSSSITDENGIAYFEGLTWGVEYTIKETSAPAGYQVDETEYPVIVTRETVNTPIIINAVDVQNNTSVRLNKYEALVMGAETEIPVFGATFELFRVTSDGDKSLGLYVTDMDGHIDVSGLPYGEYYFREYRTPVGYIQSEDVYFTLEPTISDELDTENISVNAYNQRKPGRIVVSKIDNLGNVVSGVEFTLYDADMNIVSVKTTNSNGVAEFIGLEWGTYYLKETDTPFYYQSNTSEQKIVLNNKTGVVGANVTVRINWENETVKGSVVLTKTDESGEILLSGAEYTLYTVDGEVVGVYETNEDGILRVSGLEWGSYYFKETRAPEGYGLSNEMVRFSVNSANAGAEQQITVSDPLDAKSVTITKRIKAEDINFDNGNPSFVFKMSGTDIHGENHEYHGVVSFDKDYVDANVNENGYVEKSIIYSGLIAGEYIVQEEPVSRYALSDIPDIENGEVSGEIAIMNLVENKEASVTFVNEVYEAQDYSDNQNLMNVVKSGVKLTSIFVDYDKDVLVAGAELNENTLDVFAVYDDGTTKKLTEDDYTLSLYKLPSINGDYTVTATYAEKGIARRTDFVVTIDNGSDQALLASGSVFNSKIPSSATAVVFTDESAPNGVTFTDVSANGDGSVVAWLDDTTWVVSSLVSGLKVVANQNSSRMFYNKSSLTNIDASMLDTSNVTGMTQMFSGCSSLTSLDGISNWDTSNVTSLQSTFSSCSKLTSLDLSGWDTSKVTSLNGTFWNCVSLTSLDLSGWDTSKVTNMSSTFYNCYNLTSLDGLSDWDTSKVTGLSSTFQSCSKLTSLDAISTWDTSNVTGMSQMFNGCSSLTSLDCISDWDTSNVANLSSTFNNCYNLTSLDLSGWDTSNVTNLYFTFSGCSKLTSLDLSGWDTWNVTSLYYTFYGCTAVTEAYVKTIEDANKLNASSGKPTTWKFVVKDDSDTTPYLGWASTFKSNIPSDVTYVVFTDEVAPDGAVLTDLSRYGNNAVVAWRGVGETDNLTWYVSSQVSGEKVIAPENSSNMFNGKSSLITVDANMLDVSNVSKLNGAFRGCSNLASLDGISDWDTSNVTGMTQMFNGCSSLTSLDGISDWDTSNVTTLEGTFWNCSKLTSLDAISTWDTSNITSLYYTFYGCSSLTSLDLSGWDTSNVTSMYCMFYGCTKLSSIFVSNAWDTSAAFGGSMFYNCSNLVGGSGTTYNANYTDKSRAIIDGGPSNPGYLTSAPALIDLSVIYPNTVTVDIPSMVVGGKTELNVIPVDTTKSVSSFQLNGVTIEGSTFVAPTESCTVIISDVVFKDSIYIERTDDYVTVESNHNPYDGLLHGYVDVSFEGAVGLSITYESLLRSNDYVKLYDRDGNLLVTYGYNYYYGSKQTVTKTFLVDYVRIEYITDDTENDAWGFKITVEPLDEIAIAFYSETDSSLNFIRAFEPVSVGDTYNEKVVTSVYYGFDEESYHYPCAPWYSIASSITSVNVVDEVSPKSIAYWFYGFTNCTSFNIDNLNVSNVSEMGSTFANCSIVTELDLSSWNISTICNAWGMFNGCSSLENLVIADWALSSAGSMFENCSSLESISGIEGLDTSAVTDMSYMFYGCSGLMELNLSSWDTSSVTSMSSMFYGCSSLTSLDIYEWNTSNVTGLYQAFYNCSKLTKLDLSGWDVSNVSDTYQAFYGCSAVTEAYARTQAVADKLNASSEKPASWEFVSAWPTIELTVNHPDSVNVAVPDRVEAGITEIKLIAVEENKLVISFKVDGVSVDGDTFIAPEASGSVTITDVIMIDRIVIESEHNPYPNNVSSVVYGEATFDDATSITVVLDYQTESTSYDWIYLYDVNGNIVNGKKYGGSTRTEETITVTGNYVKVVFRTDSSVNNYYGFKAVITPNYD